MKIRIAFHLLHFHIVKFVFQNKKKTSRAGSVQDSLSQHDSVLLTSIKGFQEEIYKKKKDTDNRGYGPQRVQTTNGMDHKEQRLQRGKGHKGQGPQRGHASCQPVSPNFGPPMSLRSAQVLTAPPNLLMYYLNRS